VTSRRPRVSYGAMRKNGRRLRLGMVTVLAWGGACASTAPNQFVRPGQGGECNRKRHLDVYWVDVEGGAATLLWTPAAGGNRCSSIQVIQGGRDPAARVGRAAGANRPGSARSIT